jgi:hypothetical protein
LAAGNYVGNFPFRMLDSIRSAGDA